MPSFGYTTQAIKPKGRIVYEYNPLYNYRRLSDNGLIDDMITTGESLLNFDLEHPVDIVCQESYDGSVNLILNDNKNLPRLINTRFTVKENNTYERIDRTGNTDTNLYDESEFEIDTSLLKKYINIPKVNFEGVTYGGNLPVGNYTFYFKLADGDDNETDIVAESGLVTIHMGGLNDPLTIRGGLFNEDSGKSVLFILTNLDSGYDYVKVYYSRTVGADNAPRTVRAYLVIDKYRIHLNVCTVRITGNENTNDIPVSELSLDFFMVSAAKTLAVCQNMLFLGNVSEYTPDYETLSKVSLGFVPFYRAQKEDIALGNVLNENYEGGSYYNVKNIYHKVGYWNEEIYRFGIVYIMANGSLSPVYNIRGRNDIPEYTAPDNTYDNWSILHINHDTQIINHVTLENSAGVCRINDNESRDGGYFQVRNFVFKVQSGVIDQLKDLHIKGYFFVRQKRIPTILCQTFMMGKDSYSGIPCWYLKNGMSDNSGGQWVTESFLDSMGYVTHDYSKRLITLHKNNVKVGVGICPEYELNQAYYNNLFTGGYLRLKLVTSDINQLGGEEHHVYINNHGKYTPIQSQFIKAKVTSVPDSGLIVDRNETFRAIAGSPNANTFQYLVTNTYKPKKGNFEEVQVTWSFTNGYSSCPSLLYTTTYSDESLELFYETALIFGYTINDVQFKESKAKIVRGIYSPYLGIYKTNTLTPNSLVNVYIPGYNSSEMAEYYKMRVNDESPYYSVSDRKNLNDFDLNDGENIYRGDCFISLFTHRINRNFQDPDAPCNESIVDRETWREKYDEDTDATDEINRGDLNAVKLGTYITIKCYTSTNIAMRDWDSSNPGEESLTGSKRSFYPLSGLRVDGHSKIPQSAAYNQGFSSTTGERVNFLQPAVPYIKNIFLTRVIYSEIALTDAFKNGYRVFKGVSSVDYSNQYGGITKLVEWMGNLIVVFEHAIALARVNQNAIINTQDESKIALGAVDVLELNPTMISTDFGSQWPESICKTDLYIYGVDTVGKKIWRTNGRLLEFISDFKVQKFLNDNITLSELELTPIIGVRNVKTHYNAYKHDVMFTFYDNTYGFEEKVWNLCWNEYLGAESNGWVTFYSWVPSYSANIDNIFFSYDRNSSKWITKLGQSTNGINASGVCMNNPLIPSSGEFSRTLYLKNRPIPEEGLVSYNYEIIRDNFGFYKYFRINENTLELKYNDGTPSYNDLLQYWLTKDPIQPCILLNIKCNITVTGPNSDPSSWESYEELNAGYYQSLIFITLEDIYNNTSRTRPEGRWSTRALNTWNNIKLPTFETAFWKHGQAGIIDTLERIKPCFWYGKQHPFEFEYVTGNDNAGYKLFDNLTISSNNVAPESIHYTIIGDSYDFSLLKPAMYFRQEATKALYQYNGADIIYDHAVFNEVTGYTPEMITTSDFIERDLANNPLRNRAAVSTSYKDTLFPLIYARLDTFNEVEDFYKKHISSPTYSDYPNITGGEVQWDLTSDQFSICNHVKCRDIKEVGRTRGNIQYINDKWNIQISPLVILNRNNTWIKQNNKWIPKLVLSNIPTQVYEYVDSNEGNASIPQEINTLLPDGDKYNGDTTLDFTSWDSIANKRSEVKLLDKILKTRIRYKGDKLAIILATATSFNTIA